MLVLTGHNGGPLPAELRRLVGELPAGNGGAARRAARIRGLPGYRPSLRRRPRRLARPELHPEHWAILALFAGSWIVGLAALIA